MTKYKQKSIVLLRFLATVLITNSHFNRLYPDKISFLAFGGLFGNTLFFLISGYLLSNCVDENFIEWFKRRFLRIYIPYVLIIPFIVFCSSEVNMLKSWGSVVELLIPIHRYHFLPTIIILYPVYYVIVLLRRRNKIDYKASLLVVLAVQLIYYFALYDFTYPVDADFRFIPILTYLEAMILGAIIRERGVKNRFSRLITPPIMILAFAAYVLQVFKPLDGYWSILQLYLSVIFIYTLSIIVISFEHKIKVPDVIDRISSLTLEIYLVQFLLIDAFIIYRFPINLVFCCIAIVATAGCLNYLSNIIKQRFFRQLNER